MQPTVFAHTCSYVGVDNGASCSLPASPRSAQGYCVGHSKEPDKSGTLLHHAVMAKIQSNDCDFEEFYFPYRMTWNGLSMDTPIRFNRCVFQGESG